MQLLKRQRLAKAHDAKANSLYEQRSVQYATLFQLRRIKYEGVDDSLYIHSLNYVDLDCEQFKSIDAEDVKRLHRFTAALERLVEQRTVVEWQVRTLLLPEQYDEYTKSFDLDMSHVESEDSADMPWQLRDYMDKVREGDKYTRTANLFKRSKKRDAQGRTAFGRYEDLAFGCYEEAVMDLIMCIDTDPQRNPNADAAVAGHVLRWLDRDVSAEAGCGPDISISGVPRVRGVKNKHTLVHSQPVVGQRLRKHWRQREAISKAALELLYDTPEAEELTEQQQQQLHYKLNAVLRRKHNSS